MINDQKQIRIKAVLVFAGLNYLLTLTIGVGYFTRPDLHPISIIFGLTAWVSTAFLIYLPLITAAGLAVNSSIPKALSFYFADTVTRPGCPILTVDPFRLIKIPLAIVFGLIQILFSLDMLIFRMFGFHINNRVIRLALNPEGLDSLDINSGLFLLLFFITIFLSVFEWYACRRAFNANRKDAPANRVVTAGLILLAVVCADKGLSVWGTLTDNQHIVGNFTRLPGYFSFPQRMFLDQADLLPDLDICKGAFPLIYPLQTIDTGHSSEPNIIFIVLDSYRSDMLNAEVSPKLWEFSRKAAVFSNHYSGGNSTREGIFSLFYGLLPHYWRSVLKERKPPALLDLLNRIGYDIRTYTGTGISYPELDQTCLVSIPRENLYEGHGDSKNRRDMDITNMFIKYIERRHPTSAKPFFAFIFYDSTHAAYDYPSAKEKFRPSAGYFNYLSLSSGNILPVFNRYRNAAHYCDALAGDLLERLEHMGYLKNSIIVITGDHGEAFFEKGYGVHSFGYTKEELKVPLIFYMPGGVHKEISRLTSHLDVVPTIMGRLGIKNRSEDYSSGLDLFAGNTREFVPVLDWHDRCYGFIDKNGSSFTVPCGTVARPKFFDKDYKRVPAPSPLEQYRQFLYGFKKDITRFWRTKS